MSDNMITYPLAEGRLVYVEYLMLGASLPVDGWLRMVGEAGNLAQVELSGVVFGSLGAVLGIYSADGTRLLGLAEAEAQQHAWSDEASAYQRLRWAGLSLNLEAGWRLKIEQQDWMGVWMHEPPDVGSFGLAGSYGLRAAPEPERPAGLRCLQPPTQSSELTMTWECEAPADFEGNGVKVKERWSGDFLEMRAWAERVFASSVGVICSVELERQAADFAVVTVEREGLRKVDDGGEDGGGGGGGENPEEDVGDETMWLESAGEERSLLSHSRYKDLDERAIEMLYAVANGAAPSDIVTYSENGKVKRGRPIDKLSGSAREAMWKIAKGMTHYMDRSVTLRTRERATAAQVRAVAKEVRCSLVTQVPQVATPKGRDWLDLGTEAELSGKDGWISESYVLSGDGGWDKEIYGSQA